MQNLKGNFRKWVFQKRFQQKKLAEKKESKTQEMGITELMPAAKKGTGPGLRSAEVALAAL